MDLFPILVSITVASSSLFILFVCGFYQHKYGYWKRRGVPGPRPSFPYGNFPSMFTRHLTEPIMEFYDEYKHMPFIGIYALWYPVLIVTDLELIKHVLIKDAGNFNSHGMYVNEKVEPLSANIIALEGKPWRDMRAKLSCAFSSGKLKMMFSSMITVADAFAKYIDDRTSKTNVVDFKKELDLFTSENISSCVLGLQTNSFRNGFNIISEYASQMILPFNFIGRTLMTLMFLAPQFMSKFNLKLWDKSLTEFFVSLVEDTIAMREKTLTERNDFMQILIQMKNNQLNDDQGNLIDQEGIKLTTEQMAAQAFAFILAGFETSSSASSFTLHELASKPEIQERARKEILETLEAHDGICTYEALMEMKYLYAVVEETLRFHPPLYMVLRQCTGDYKIPGTDVIIEKNTQVYIPNFKMQMDPRYFENPEKFEPQRFLPENKGKILACTYMPFGEGPRICLGQKFGMIQSMLALVMILKDYKVFPCEKTRNPVEMNAAPIHTIPLHVWLKVEKIENKTN